MTGMPWMRLWIEDLDRDCSTLSLRARGAWVWMLFELRRHGGSRSLSLSQWAQVVRSSEQETALALQEIIEQQICDSSVTEALPDNAKITAGNEKITIICRRLIREARDKNLNTLRQRRFKEKHGGNAIDNVSLTPQKQEAIEAIEAEAERECAFSSSGRRGQVAEISTGKTTLTPAPAAADLLTPEMLQWTEAAAPDIDPLAEAEKCLDYYRRSGKTFADWPSTLRTWIRRAAEFEHRAREPSGRRETVQERNDRVFARIEAEERGAT